MTDTAAKDKRLFVRLEEQDLAYVQAQGEVLGLDASTWVRMMIRKLRLGQIGENLRAEHRITHSIGATPAVDMSDYYRTGGYEAPAGADESAQSEQPVDTDDLVNRKLAEAEIKGLTQPRSNHDDDDMGAEFAAATGGIQPVGERRAWNSGQPKTFRPE